MGAALLSNRSYQPYSLVGPVFAAIVLVVPSSRSETMKGNHPQEISSPSLDGATPLPVPHPDGRPDVARDKRGITILPHTGGATPVIPPPVRGITPIVPPPSMFPGQPSVQPESRIKNLSIVHDTAPMGRWAGLPSPSRPFLRS
jgi:hypothetical protein